jgi:hypothetical protein
MEYCFGGQGVERFWGIHSVLKKGDYNYIIGANADYLDGDVECDLFPDDLQDDAWLLEVKDCNYYKPSMPVIISGPDKICSTNAATSIYSVNPADWATSYEWSVEPIDVGSLLTDSLNVQITWNTQFEGLISIRARSFNDCGYSAWSGPKLTQVYTCMGIEEPKTGGISIIAYPNPVNNILNIQLQPMPDYAGSELSIYTLQGKDVLSFQINSAKTSFSIKEIKPGIYIVSVKLQDLVLVQKLVIF